jgi:hypothetical protein
MNKLSLLKLFREDLISSSYEIIEEGINPSIHYPFERERKNLWTFEDRSRNKHFIILNQSLYKGDTVAEVKFGWIDSKGDRRYDKPPTYDEKVFNTHLNILLEEILNYYGKYFTDIYLEAIDQLRYRLYKRALNNNLDRSKYQLEEREEKFTLIIKHELDI